ncbi:hypothetical protein Tco_0972098 [Tanacetum coccineum]
MCTGFMAGTVACDDFVTPFTPDTHRLWGCGWPWAFDVKGTGKPNLGGPGRRGGRQLIPAMETRKPRVKAITDKMWPRSHRVLTCVSSLESDRWPLILCGPSNSISTKDLQCKDRLLLRKGIGSTRNGTYVLRALRLSSAFALYWRFNWECADWVLDMITKNRAAAASKSNKTRAKKKARSYD